MLKTQTFLVPFLGIYCCFGLLYIKSVPVRFLNVHCRTAGCFCWFLLHLLERTMGVSTASKGGFFVLKASVAVSESLYCYLVGILCIFTPCHCSRCSRRFQTSTWFQCVKRNSVYHRLQDKKAFQTELWPGVQPAVLHSRINRYVTSQTINISQLEARLLATVSVLYCSYMVLYK